MEPEKENKEDIKATMDDLHDSGIDIVESAPAIQGNEFSPGAAPKLDPTQSVPKMASFQNIQNRPSAQSIVDGVLGISSVKTQDNSKNDPSIKPLRTFKTDAEEAIKYNNVSKINIAVAEHQRKESSPVAATPIEYENGSKSSKIFAVILTLGIILGAGAGGYYWFSMQSSVAPVTNKVPKGLSVKTPIAYDKVDIVNLSRDENPLTSIASKLASSEVPIGQVHAILPLPYGTTTITASPAVIFSGTRMPDRLERSISQDYMVGTYFYNLNSPFIILKNTFFQNAFAGMLDWEEDMRNDLISFIKVSYPNETLSSTSGDIFSDMVISNTDARILKNPSGAVILAYAFVDKDVIVISTNTETLKYLIDKLLAVRVVQ